MENETNFFNELNTVDVSDKIKSKNNLSYLSWASAWAEVKKRYPDATYTIYPQTMDELGNTRFWHEDGVSGWVTVGVTINGLEHKETLAIMDYRNAAIPAGKITSVDANKSIKRCLVKACALHGLALYIYEGEDLPEQTARAIELKNDIKDIISKKVSVSESAKAKVAELCKAAEKQANPDLRDDLISGNYKNIEDVDILESLKKQLMAIRK